MKKFATLLALALVAMAANAQSIVGQWRAGSDGSYTIKEFRADGTMVDKVYQNEAQSMDNGFAVVSKGYLTCKAKYIVEGKNLGITYDSNTASGKMQYAISGGSKAQNQKIQQQAQSYFKEMERSAIAQYKKEVAEHRSMAFQIINLSGTTLSLMQPDGSVITFTRVGGSTGSSSKKSATKKKRK